MPGVLKIRAIIIDSKTELMVANSKLRVARELPELTIATPVRISTVPAGRESGRKARAAPRFGLYCPVSQASVMQIDSNVRPKGGGVSPACVINLRIRAPVSGCGMA